MFERGRRYLARSELNHEGSDALNPPRKEKYVDPHDHEQCTTMNDAPNLEQQGFTLILLTHGAMHTFSRYTELLKPLLACSSGLHSNRDFRPAHNSHGNLTVLFLSFINL